MTYRCGAYDGHDEAESIPNLKISSSDDDDEFHAKMSDEKAAEDELSNLLSQPREILEKIINYLNPKALHELALSCQYLYRFSVLSKGIDVVFPVEFVRINKRLNCNDNFTGSFNYKYCERGDFEKYLEMLQKWHFAIHVGELYMLDSGNELLNLKDLFMRNGVKKIRRLHFIPRTLEEAGVTTDFVKVFGVESVIMGRGFGGQMPTEVLRTCLKFPVTELEMPVIHGHVDVDALRDCSISRMDTNLRITPADVEEIAQIWKSRKGLERWAFSHITVNDVQFDNIFNSYEVVPFDYSGPIDRSRRLAFKKVVEENDFTTYFYLLREDGLAFFVSFVYYRLDYDQVRFVIRFEMCPFDEYPLALREH